MNLNQDVVLRLCQLHHTKQSGACLCQILSHLHQQIFSQLMKCETSKWLLRDQMANGRDSLTKYVIVGVYVYVRRTLYGVISQELAQNF